MDPAVLRLVDQMHIPERRDQARANTRFGFLKWLDYSTRSSRHAMPTLPARPDRPPRRDRPHRVRHA
jgi:hypothetical protein